MKREILSACLIIALVITPTAAQIRITADDYQKIVGHHVEATVHEMSAQHYPSLTGLVDAVGPDKTYDFTPYTYPTSIPGNYDGASSAGGTPGAAIVALATANYVNIYQIAGAYGGTSYIYYDLKADGLFTLGNAFVQATDFDRNSIIDTGWSTNAPHERSPLPLMMGSTWTQSWVSTNTGFGVTSETTTSEQGVVEGWGTLVTPAGSAPALRVKRTRTRTMTGLPPSQSTFTLFETGTTLSASIVTDATGAVSSATYTNGTITSDATREWHPSFNLHQNVPNPFTSSTRISFSIKHPAYVTLKLFDVRGTEIATLIDASLSVGEHAANVHADDLTNGIYLYRLQVDGRAVQRQFVVQR